MWLEKVYDLRKIDNLIKDGKTQQNYRHITKIILKLILHIIVHTV